ncbi:MAG: HEPN domain-containing protein [archaeon]
MLRETRFDWCKKQSKGLRLAEPNENLTAVYLRKSRSALNMLDSALEKEELEWILDTSYYAKYFAVYALFMRAGIKSQIHDCTIAALKRLFVEEKIVPEGILDELERSKELRVNALYYDKELGQDEILSRASKSAGFCLEVESIIQRLSADKISLVRIKFRKNSPISRLSSPR